MHPFPFLAFGQGCHSLASRNSMRPGKHGPETAPGILLYRTAVIQRIPRNIGQGIADMPFIVQRDSLHIYMTEKTLFLILGAEPLGIHPFQLQTKGVGIFLRNRQHRHVAVIGNRRINHYNYILPLCADGYVFDHYVIIFFVPADDGFFQPLHAHMKRLDISKIP